MELHLQIADNGKKQMASISMPVGTEYYGGSAVDYTPKT